MNLMIERSDGLFYVVLLPHKIRKTWSFVNLSKGHICNCEFSSKDEALKDISLDDRVISWKDVG